MAPGHANSIEKKVEFEEGQKVRINLKLEPHKPEERVTGIFIKQSGMVYQFLSRRLPNQIRMTSIGSDEIKYNPKENLVTCGISFQSYVDQNSEKKMYEEMDTILQEAGL